MRVLSNLSKLTLQSMLMLLIFFFGCEKDNEKEPIADNPTNGLTTAIFNPDITYGTLIDQDGNLYKTVTIGTQTWMAENLRTTKYNNGTSIPNITNTNEWNTTDSGAYCNYNNLTNLDSIATFGRLYNWKAVNTGKLAPKGWHVASDEDWEKLVSYLGNNYKIVGGLLKETTTEHWKFPNTGATNKSGFTALPAGIRFANGYFIPYSNGASYWWTSTSAGDIFSKIKYVNAEFSYINSNIGSKEDGFSVRCIKN